MLSILTALGLVIFASPHSVEAKPIIALEPVYVETVPSTLRPLTVEEKIVEEANRLGYPSKRALAIAKAESNYNPQARNKTSTASGLYQFLDGTFHTYCIEKFGLTDSMTEKNNEDIQLTCAITMLAEGGENHWEASRFLWEKDI